MTTQKQTHVPEHPQGGFIHGTQMSQEQGCCGTVSQDTGAGCCGEPLASTGMSTVAPRRGCC